MRYFIVAISLLFLVPAISSAQVVINEIMYDLEGADKSHEWIEIFVTGAQPLDLTDWRFNDGSNHVLNPPPEKSGQGSITIQPGEYIILADNAMIFIADHPGFSGTVIDTVMSLNNTSDTLSLIDANGSTVDLASYSSDLGAKGDGNSLQLSGGSFTASTPTPGKANSGAGSETSNAGDSSGTESSSSGGGSYVPIEPQIFASAGGNRTVIVGADSVFEGQALGFEKEPLSSARYIWNFGNGETREGKKILQHYSYPGEYVVSLSVSSGKYSALDRIVVTAEPAQVSIVSATAEFIEISNKSGKELNLSFWYIQAGNKNFLIPEGTIFLPNKTVRFSSLVTGLVVVSVDDVSLLYPNGNVAYKYDDPVQPKEQTSNYAASVYTAYTAEQNATPKQVVSINTKQKSEQNLDVSAGAAVEDAKSESNPIYKWLLALVGIIGVSVVSLIFIRKGSESDEIKILE